MLWREEERMEELEERWEREGSGRRRRCDCVAWREKGEMLGEGRRRRLEDILIFAVGEFAVVVFGEVR